MRADPVAVTPDEMSLTAGDLMNKHDIDRLPVVESKEDRRRAVGENAALAGGTISNRPLWFLIRRDNLL